MGIFEKPPGSGVWWILYYASGKRYREKVGSKRLAQAAYEQRKTETRQGKFSADLVQPKQRLVLDVLLDKYQPHFLALRSPEQHKRYKRKWSACLGYRAVETIKPGELESIRRQMLASLAPASVNREFAFLRRVFSLAKTDGLIPENPVDRVQQLRENNQRCRWLTADEEAKLLAHMEEHDREIVVLAIHTGLRRGELFTLERNQVDLERGWLQVVATKNGTSRRVPLTAKAKAILEARLARHSGRYVLESPRSGRPKNAHNFYQRVFVPAVEAAKLHDVVFHDLRHTFCSRLVMAGVPLNTVRELAGHKTLEMTLRYSHLAPDHQALAIRALDG